jgi:MarR family transcriptional regulator, organic hydroperoxide resistance regulator
MADRTIPGDTASTTAEANLDAFLRHRDDVPTECRAALISSLSRLRGSDDPVVTFAGLPRACVPEFADGCRVELSDGAEAPFRVTYPDSPADGPERTAAHRIGSDQLLLTPFRAVSRTCYPSYAGVVTHWWTGRAPSESDAAIADLMVRHLIALVDHERLMVALAQAEDRAASLALEAISGRTINLATGIVMRQNGLPPDDAEDLLRQSARIAGKSLPQLAAGVVRSCALPLPENQPQWKLLTLGSKLRPVGEVGPVSDLRRLFNDIVRFEIELWNAIDARLKNEFGLPLTHFEPMSVIDRLPGCRVYDIARELGVTTGGTSKLVDRIEANGYCRRLPNPGDRRSSLLELTPEGRRILAEAGVAFDEELQSRLGAVVPERTLRQFASTLARLRAAGHGAAMTETA